MFGDLLLGGDGQKDWCRAEVAEEEDGEVEARLVRDIDGKRS
jgi:hypothetical protein